MKERHIHLLKRRITAFTGIITVGFLVLTSCIGFSQTADSLNVLEFTLPDLQGKSLSSNNALGKRATLVVFWSTWERDSIKLLRVLQEVREKYKTQGLEAIGICVEQQTFDDDTISRILETVNRNNILFPILLDTNLHVFRECNIIAVPTTLLISADKKILRRMSGYPIVGREEFFDSVIEYIEGPKADRVLSEAQKRKRQAKKDVIRHLNMAQLEFRKENLTKSKKHAAKAVELDTSFVESIWLLTEIALEEGQVNEAEVLIQRALKLEHDASDGQLLYGRILAEQGKFEQGAGVIKGVIQKDSTSALGHCYLAYIEGMSGNIESSIREFDKAEMLDKSEYRVPLLRAKVFDHSGKIEEAKTEMSKAKKLRQSRE